METTQLTAALDKILGQVSDIEDYGEEELRARARQIKRLAFQALTGPRSPQLACGPEDALRPRTPEEIEARTNEILGPAGPLAGLEFPEIEVK